MGDIYSKGKELNILKIKQLIIFFLFIHSLVFAYEPRASQIQNTPSGNVASSNIQDAINEIDNEKSATTHNHNLADLLEKSYNSLTDKPDLSVYFHKSTDDLDDILAGTTNIHFTTTLKSQYDIAYTHSQSSHLQLGETETTAYRGDRGKIAYDHSQSSHLQLGETETTAYRGDRGKAAYDHSQITHNFGLAGTKDVDESAIADTKILQYDSASGKLKYVEKPTGITDHSFLSNLDYEHAGHTGFQPALGFTPENIANKKTDLADNSDTYYPTQKAVKTAVDAKQDSLGFTPENIANKVTSFQQTPDNTHYPSEKLVKDSLDGKENSLGFTPENSANKAQANGYASLDASSKVVQDPANATATPAANKIPIADGDGKLIDWITESDPLALKTADTDNIKDTHPDWGSDTNQIGSDDIPIANAPDDSWSDGINTWTNATSVAYALDDVNETISYLAPADASSMNAQAMTYTGTTLYTGRLSAGNTNYKTGQGVGSTVAYIANDATFTILSPNQSTTFNKADEGSMKYYINGVLNDTVDCAASFQEANRAGTQTNTPWTGAAGNLAVTSVGWYNSFPKWQKGNASMYVVPGDLRQGYNYFDLKHDLTVDQDTATLDIFYDNDAGSSPSVNTPTITENTPAWFYISGVKMYGGGSTFNLSVTGSDCFDNTYHQASPLTYTVTSSLIAAGNIDYNDAAVSGVSNPPAIGETMTVTNKVLTMVSSGSNIRSTNMRFTVMPRDPYGTYSAGTSASANRLADTYSTTSTAVYEYFDDENRRLPAGAYDSIPGSITGQWTSSTTLTNGMAQQYNGSLYFPTTNFSSGYLPTGNPNYSTFSGNQAYYRAIYHASTPHSNGSLELGNLTGANVGAVGSGNINVEIKFPTQTGWLDLGKDYVQATFTGADGDGCRTSQSGDDWGWTAGTFSTANSGYMYIIRITFRNSTNSITQIRELGW